jgi:NAD(P)-dependent dehydrogenase (short-subunit alcohol dehydrogenase family)
MVNVGEAQNAEWDRILDITLKGVFLGCKFAIPRCGNAGAGAS